MGTPSLYAAWLGAMPYGEALSLQRDLAERRRQGTIPDTLLLLEHPHVYTIGRRGRDEDVLIDVERLAAIGAAVVPTDRGGETTYHGPGQLVAYPIMDLRDSGVWPVSYVRRLETAIMRILAEYAVAGRCVEGKTGIWVGAESTGTGGPPGRKIAAIGVRISAGISQHGFALNVCTDLAYFSHIVACGMPGLQVASIESETGSAVSTQAVAGVAAQHVATAFGRALHWAQPAALAG